MSESKVQTFCFGDNISIGNVDNLIPELDNFFNSNNNLKIIFDMSNVLTCDSYGITLLLQYYRKAEKMKKKLLLYKLQPFLYNLFNNCGLLKIFTVINHIDE